MRCGQTLPVEHAILLSEDIPAVGTFILLLGKNAVILRIVQDEFPLLFTADCDVAREGLGHGDDVLIGFVPWDRVIVALLAGFPLDVEGPHQ